MNLLGELKRRNVLRVATAYVVTSWLLIQVAETIFPLYGYGDGPARMVVNLLAIGFLPVLILAWTFEWTPEGIKKDAEVDRSKPSLQTADKKLDRIIMVVLALALGYFAFDKFMLAPKREQSLTTAATEAALQQIREEALLEQMNSKSIAVLPFANHTGQEQDEFFTNGMHDELLTRLSRISEMKVISRTSVMRYRDTLMSIPEIAKELSVATILEGGVQRSGNQVRINVQLIDAQTDEHLWAEIYDRELSTENLFAIQSDISSSIAGALEATMSPAEQVRVFAMPTDNLEAYNHYLRGRQLIAARNRAKTEQAQEQFLRATEIDPDFALAWVGAADTLTLLYEYGAIGRDEYLGRHKPMVDKALALDDQLGEAYVSLSAYYGTMADSYDREKHQAALLKAIELNPNYAQAYQWYAGSLPIKTKEQRSKKISLLYKAAELDPRSSIVQLNLAGALRDIGKPEEGTRVIEQLLEWDPDFALGVRALARNKLESGQLAEAIQLTDRALELDPGNGSILIDQALNYLRLGDFDAMYDIRNRLGEIASAEFMSILWLDHEIWIARSQRQEGLEELRKRFGAQFGETALHQNLVYDLHLHSGDLEQAAEWMLKFLPPQPSGEKWERGPSEESFAKHCEYAGVLIRTGHEAWGTWALKGIAAAVDARLERGEIYVDSLFDRLRCTLLEGDIPAALTLLESEVAKGYYYNFRGWRTEPWFRELEGTPRYDAILATIEAGLAEQRALLAQLQAADQASP